ncbi:C-terminal binding protein [Puerhibacterium puerhi]|uniref:C-terminal binding protein n=1 Tax=Puerhibacterium puerhi TaxID=2692623 RepID=UPI0013578E5B|nr:C-terminal binding protein [Puerhibacterium puerhi]
MSAEVLVPGAAGAPVVVITDCDHDAFDAEIAVARAAGVELRLAQARTRDELLEVAADADGLVVQYADITAEVLDGLPRLRVVSRYGVGVDSVDLAAAAARGVAVCNVPDYGTEAVSDHAIALALTASRGIARLDRGVRAGRFELEAVRPVGQVRGSTFAVLGLGRIGQATAAKARGLGYEVLGHDVMAPEGATEWHGVPLASFEDVLRRADVLSLHTPLTDATHHLLGERELALLKPTAVLVNTSRGGVVDTDALVAALAGGRLRAAGIDVHEQEPVPTGHPLTRLENVVLTPHLAWYTEESYAELKRRTVQNAVDVIAGRGSANLVTEDNR